MSDLAGGRLAENDSADPGRNTGRQLLNRGIYAHESATMTSLDAGSHQGHRRNEPDMQIISSVEAATATTSGTAGRFVTSRIGRTEARDISVKTRLLPERSAQRPIQFMLNIVQKPPQI